MFLIIYEDHGKEPKNIATAINVPKAKAFIAAELGLENAAELEDYEWETDEDGRMLCILGDAQYVIEPLKHVS